VAVLALMIRIVFSELVERFDVWLVTSAFQPRRRMIASAAAGCKRL
jgi:hypothetical protein